MGAPNATAAQIYVKNSQMATKKFLYTDLSLDHPVSYDIVTVNQNDT